MRFLKNFVLMAAVGAVLPAAASTVTLTFEGVTDKASIGSYYSSDGISFGANALGLIDADAPGGTTGNFENEPSASTVMDWVTGGTTYLSSSSGFVGSISFYYSAFDLGSVTVRSGLSGTGDVLGTSSLSVQATRNCDTADGDFCHWDLVTISFDGTAKSIVFGGTADRVLFDNITLNLNGSSAAPEPTSIALVGAALLGLGAARRRRAA